ncbi:COP9 signalosome complex subunit 7b-like [Megalops cyprinoides]|uniref:COP9 signalosome complex subunit 7b-like n=1 Tax=Megalops cyprinoides TaxID=118141 RepID=UPI0018649B22|nr:COP9 signalosome complex subunit 7b-like [Megalops cyprinoides]
MAGEQKHNCYLQQYMSLAKNTKGLALIALINQLLEAPGVYVFGEFLELPCVKELSRGPNVGYIKLLNIFAYGTYMDYRASKDTLPPLSETQKNKLRHLTIVSLAANVQCIPYTVLLEDLELQSLRQLEDLVIDAVYGDIIRGKLDHCRQLLEVEACIGRDTCPKELSSIASTLQRWCTGCESASAVIGLQVDRLNEFHESSLSAQQLIETEVASIKQRMSSEEAECVVEQESASSTEHRQSLRTMAKRKSLSPPRR